MHSPLWYNNDSSLHIHAGSARRGSRLPSGRRRRLPGKRGVGPDRASSSPGIERTTLAAPRAALDTLPSVAYLPPTLQQHTSARLWDDQFRRKSILHNPRRQVGSVREIVVL